MFVYLDLGTIGGASVAQQRLPTAGAVYAWFRAVRLGNLGDADQFVDRVLRLASARAAPDASARPDPLHLVTLESSSQLSERKREVLTALCTEQSFRTYLAHVLEQASLLQPPLYVGKAENLQSRFLQHTRPTSTLSRRLRSEGIELADCIFAYGILDVAWNRPDSETLTLVEELLTRICRPGFVLRPG